MAATAVVALTACGSSPDSRPPDVTQADAASSSAPASAVKVNFQRLPPSIITLSDAQIAKIRG